MLINQVSHVTKKKTDQLPMHAKRRLFHHSSDYVALDGLWREFISGVIFLRKANEFLDNKTAGKSRGSVIGKWNHVSPLSTSAAAADCNDSRRFLRRKTSPRRHLTWKATVHFSPGAAPGGWVFVCVWDEGVCFYIPLVSQRDDNNSILPLVR